MIADLMLRVKNSQTELSVWGTGMAEREFLFIDDAVEGIVAALQGQAGEFFQCGNRCFYSNTFPSRVDD